MSANDPDPTDLLKAILVTQDHITQVRGEMLNEADVRRAIADGVVDGIRRASADTEFMRKFWQSGFAEFSANASDGASRWIGRRIMTAFIVSVTTAGLVWLIKTGALK